MAASTPKTIILKNRTDSVPFIKEAIANGVMTPGHLVEIDSNGKVKKHATAGGNARKLFAVEQNLINNTSAADIDTASADGDQVPYVVAERGDEIYAWVEANGAAIVIGDALESAGDGTLQKHTPRAVDEGGAATFTQYNDAIVGYAIEAKDNSANGSAVRIKIEVA
jgi:hypothetical protein